MSVDNTYIDTLLERYFQAESSLEEESVLRAYFLQEDIDPRHQHARPIFMWAQNEQSLTVPSDFEGKVMERIRREPETLPATLWIRYRRAVAIAASLAILTIAIWWIAAPKIVDNESALVALEEDTFQNPDEAYREFEAALALVAQAMQQGENLTMESVTPTSELDVFAN